MDKVILENKEWESSQLELQRLILWARDNSQDWYRLCHPDSYDEDITCTFGLVKKLYQEKLYTLMFFLIYSQNYMLGIDCTIAKTAFECFHDIPIEVLVQRMFENLESAAKEVERHRYRKTKE